MIRSSTKKDRRLAKNECNQTFAPCSGGAKGYQVLAEMKENRCMRTLRRAAVQGAQQYTVSDMLVSHGANSTTGDRPPEPSYTMRLCNKKL